LCHTLTRSLGCSHGIVFSFWVIKSCHYGNAIRILEIPCPPLLLTLLFF
jgi:hypothetical protein